MGNTISQNVVLPKSLLHCFNKDGKFDSNELLLLYRHHLLWQPTLCKKVCTALINAALTIAGEEMSLDNQHEMSNQKHRSCF
jgi:hypothetical protein